MANETLYPYGTGGELPSSIGVINDLTTGGADKALSAEMGKFLNGTKQDNVFENITASKSTNGFCISGNIASDGTVSNSSYSKHTLFLPVVGGSQLTYYLDARDTTKYIAFYSSASESGFISAVQVASLTVTSITVPDSAKYFRASARADSDTTYDSYVTYQVDTTDKDVTDINNLMAISTQQTTLSASDIIAMGIVGSVKSAGTLETADTSWRTTKFIHVENNTIVEFIGTGYAYLAVYSSESESNVLFTIKSSSTAQQVIIPPVGDFYVRYSVINTDSTSYLSYCAKDSAVIEGIESYLPPVKISGKWQSIGTSITWYNNHVSSGFTKGYQDRVMEVIQFSDFSNIGVNGGSLVGFATSSLNTIVEADYYTIEHGINDWMQGQTVGTINDFINDTGASTFYGAYRKTIDAIYSANHDATIIICTPRKGYGFNSSLPDHWYDAKNGKYLKDYANAAIEIAKFLSLPICDWFNESGTNQYNLADDSIDVALHPNDGGYQKMANLLILTFKKALGLW